MKHENPAMAAALILGAMLMLGLFDNAVGRIARDMGLWQFHLLRAVLAMALLAVMAALGLVRLAPRRRWAVALRGGFTALSMLIYFGSLAFLSVAEAAAGLFSAPIWVLAISALFLGQKAGWVRIVAALVGFAGVLLVLDPLAGGFRPVALVPVAAGLFYAIGSIATRQWCEGESTFAMLLWFFIVLFVMGAAGLTALALWPHPVPEGAAGFVLRGWVWPVSGLSLALTAVQAVAAIAGVGLIIRAYQLGDAAHVALFEYSLLVFAAFWGWALWGQVPGLRAWLGMGLIASTGMFLALAGRGESR